MAQLLKRLIFAAALAGLTCQAVAAEPLDSIAAIVNKDVITSQQVDSALTNVTNNLQAQGAKLPPKNLLRKQVLNQLIDRSLQLQLAKQNGISVSDSDLNAAIDRLAKSKGISSAELVRQGSQQLHLSAQQFKAMLRKQLLLQQIQQSAIAGKVQVTEQSVDQMYNQYLHAANQAKSYHIADILIALPNHATKTQVRLAQAKANMISKKYHAGTPFDRLARDYSDAGNALQGGDLGWKTLAELPTLFEKVVPSLKTKQISTPISAPNGLHIIQLIASKSLAAQNVTKAKVRQYLLERAIHQQTEKWLNQLKQTAYIKIMS